MKTYNLEHNTGSFSIEEDLKIKLDGEEMLNMGWTLDDRDSPETEFMLLITTDGMIECMILATNDEWVGASYDFELIPSIHDLIRQGFLYIEDGILFIGQ